MPEPLRIERDRAIQISLKKLSPASGCGLALSQIPKFNSSDPLNEIMKNYGYERIQADRVAQKIITQPSLLKPFYTNAFSNKTPLVENFRSTYGRQPVYLAYDPEIGTAWFVSQTENRLALLNYYRDALTFTLKNLGIHLIGSTTRLTPTGWQNLYDLISDEFLKNHGPIERIEILALIPGVRWHPPVLGIGTNLLNMKEFKDIRATAESAIKNDIEK